MTPLMLALKEKCPNEVIYPLISESAINSFTSTGKTALIYAIENSYDKDIILALIRRGADVNCRCEGMTPIFFAVKFHCSYEIVKILIDAGAVVNVLDDYGRSVLMITSWDKCDLNTCRYKAVIHLLINNGANLKSIGPGGYTVLHVVNCFYLMYLAIDKGVSIETKNSLGLTPLGLAIVKNKFAIKSLLLLKANPNCSICYKTPLHYFQTLSGKFIESLLYHGANFEAKSRAHQMTAFELILNHQAHHNLSSPEIDFKTLIFIRYYVLFIDENGLANSFDNLVDIKREFFLSFVQRCKEEVKKMRVTFIKDDLTFYEFCTLKKYKDSGYVYILSNEYNYSHEQIRRMFKIYHKDIILRIDDNIALGTKNFSFAVLFYVLFLWSICRN